jgi:hypothetical protein
MAKGQSPWHIDVLKLPRIGKCKDEACGAYRTIHNDQPDFCVRCAVNDDYVCLFNVNRRHRFLINAVQKAGYKVDRYAAIIDRAINSYIASGRTDTYYRKALTETIRKLREYRRKPVAV